MLPPTHQACKSPSTHHPSSAAPVLRRAGRYPDRYPLDEEDLWMGGPFVTLVDAISIANVDSSSRSKVAGARRVQRDQFRSQMVAALQQACSRPTCVGHRRSWIAVRGRGTDARHSFSAHSAAMKLKIEDFMLCGCIGVGPCMAQ